MPRPWLQFVTSLALQRAVDSRYGYVLPNSHGQVGKLRLSVPLFTNRNTWVRGKPSPAPPLPSLFLTDLTVSSTHLTPHLDFQVGIRNVANEKHFDPIALFSKYDTMQLPGRSWFVTMTWRQRPE
jgi:hypothetical protein